MALLEVRNLDVYYGKIHALKGISIDVELGETVGVIGPNGAGKTTLLDSIVGLTNRHGQILFNKSDITGLPPWKIIRMMGIGYVTERRKVFPYMSVKDNLLVGGYCKKDNLQENLKKVFELFPILKERQNQPAGTLSGGEQQMLAIGKCLMSDPKMILIDEPTLGLAPIVINKISEAIEKLKRTGITILIAEQNVSFTLVHSDRIYVLENGSIIASGTPEELKAEEYIRKAYFGV